MQARVVILLAAALLLSGCSESRGAAKRTEWTVDLLEANFRCERGDEGAIARWMDTTSSSVYLHVLARKRVPCDAFISGRYLVSGQEVRVELINGEVPECVPQDEYCLLDTAMTLAEPAIDPSRDARIVVAVNGGPTLSATLTARG